VFVRIDLGDDNVTNLAEGFTDLIVVLIIAQTLIIEKYFQ
jgi:hypothetical protein